MNKLATIFSLFIIILFISSCKNDTSLQSYLVNTSGKEGFYTGDLPVNSVLSAKADVSEDVKETIKSIQKINIVFLPKTTDNTTTYELEKGKLKAIFKGNEDYKTLLSMKAKGMNVTIYYAGDTAAIDEVIAFGYGEETGVGVARLLGKNMNPAKIIQTINSMNFDESSGALKQFSKMLKK